MPLDLSQSAISSASGLVFTYTTPDPSNVGMFSASQASLAAFVGIVMFCRYRDSRNKEPLRIDQSPPNSSVMSSATLAVAVAVVHRTGVPSSSSINQSINQKSSMKSLHSIHNVVDRGVQTQTMWEEHAGQVVHRDQLIIC